MKNEFFKERDVFLVTSFGTEDRNAPKRIPAGSEVYEYIIFRGSDIKDLHVKPVPVKQEAVADDPAIVSVSLRHDTFCVLFNDHDAAVSKANISPICF